MKIIRLCAGLLCAINLNSLGMSIGLQDLAGDILIQELFPLLDEVSYNRLQIVSKAWQTAIAQSYTSMAPQKRNDALLQAAYRNKISLTQVLLAAGADIHYQDHCMYGPALHVAAFCGHPKIVNLLLKQPHIDINQQLSTQNYLFPGMTPLHMAALYCNGISAYEKDDGKSKVAQILIDHGAQLEIKDSKGQTPLHETHHSSQKKVRDVLIRAGAQNTRNPANHNQYSSYEVLHIKYGDIPLITSLIVLGSYLVYKLYHWYKAKNKKQDDKKPAGKLEQNQTAKMQHA
jgi:ankyrin repeat protein